jgi:hypothetical protein
MAYLVLVINTPNDSIKQLNSEVQLPTKVDETIKNCINVLSAVEGGLKAASIQVTVRDTDPSVSTSGSGSTQNTYSHL